MASMITITGNLGADAERRKAGEHDLAELRVAVTTGWGDRKVTTWWHVEQWGKPAEWIGELRKGAAVTVIGEAYMREWTSKDGKAGTTPTIKAVEVVAHERASAASGGASSGKPQQQQRKPQSNAGGGWGVGRDDDHGF